MTAKLILIFSSQSSNISLSKGERRTYHRAKPDRISALVQAREERTVSRMAIYHFSMSNINRSSGSNSCASAAYITGEKIRCDRTAQTFSYGRRERVLCHETISPVGASFRNASELFNSIETYEAASNARCAKKIEVALPRELSQAEQQAVISDFIQANITVHGYACTWALHSDQDGKNPHAHIIIASRQLGADGEWKKNKFRSEFALDENGERIPMIDPETGLQKVRIRPNKGTERLWVRRQVEYNYIDQKSILESMRASWTNICNRYLQKANVNERIDHRSYKDRGIDQIPTVHEGYAARRMEQDGQISYRCEQNRRIKDELVERRRKKEIEDAEKLERAEGLEAIRARFTKSNRGIVSETQRSERSRQALGRSSRRLEDASSKLEEAIRRINEPIRQISKSIREISRTIQEYNKRPRESLTSRLEHFQREQAQQVKKTKKQAEKGAQATKKRNRFEL